MQGQEQAPGQASEAHLGMEWENWGVHQVSGWLMIVDEVQESAVFSWPQNQYIWREDPDTAPSFSVFLFLTR